MTDSDGYQFDDLPAIFVPNTDYGNGVYRRKIRLTPRENSIVGELEDSFHGFQVHVDHDRDQVTAIKAEFPRIPFSTCDGAEAPLQQLVGSPIGKPVPLLSANLIPTEHCTHLLDLCLLTISNIGNTDAAIEYHAEVTDEKDGLSDLKVWRNEQLIHEWQSKENRIVFPAHLAGKTLFKGFANWANDVFSGIENEAAFVLQKGNFVAMGRRLDIEKMAGQRASAEVSGTVCYTYSPERAEKAIRLANTARDFSSAPEQVLKFR